MHKSMYGRMRKILYQHISLFFSDRNSEKLNLKLSFLSFKWSTSSGDGNGCKTCLNISLLHSLNLSVMCELIITNNRLALPTDKAYKVAILNSNEQLEYPDLHSQCLLWGIGLIKGKDGLGLQQAKGENVLRMRAGKGLKTKCSHVKGNTTPICQVWCKLSIKITSLMNSSE
jgi:hypothetical protein